MAFGTGSAIAHRAVDAVTGPRIIQHETVVSAAPAATSMGTDAVGIDACSIHSKAFQDVCCYLFLRVKNFLLYSTKYIIFLKNCFCHFWSVVAVH